MSYFPNQSISIIGNVIPAYAGLVGGTDGTDLRALLTDSSGQLKVLVENFPVTQPVSGTVSVTQGTSPWVVSNSGVFAVQDSTAEGYLSTLAGTVSGGKLSVQGTVGATQSTTPWIVAGGGTAGAPGTAVLTVQGISSGTPQPVQIAADSYVPALNATGQVSVTNAATLIIAANTSRQGVVITNTSTTVTVFVGASGVTATTGQALLPGNSLTAPATSAFYGITAASTATVSFMEVQ